MLAVTRRNNIMELIVEKKNVTVIELSNLFDVTNETIRRDLKHLEKEGKLHKTHGGAFVKDGTTRDINVNIRDGAYIQNKKDISNECKKLINNGDTIFLDSSTTSHNIAFSIKEKRVTVVTNSLLISNFLSKYENIELVTIGGTLNRAHMCFTGKTTMQTLQNYFVEKAFISCRALSIINGITDSNESIAEIRLQALNQANKVYIVADYTKFDRTAFINITKYENIEAIVTDKKLNDEWIKFLNTKKITLYYPNK